ncbi:hypothetical protein DFH06DRAFT_1304034 [Mycena polygramma]|nr:hypothetical protein DFH06DRAFT_1304034 [Mycena polygramma]
MSTRFGGLQQLVHLPRHPLALVLRLGELDWIAQVAPEPWLAPDPTPPPIEAELNGPYRLPAPIEPLMFFDPDRMGRYPHDPKFAFACGGRCYFYREEDESVRLYRAHYASPTAFLHAARASFEDPALPVSARHEELLEGYRRWLDDHYPEIYPAELSERLCDELEWEGMHPPANDIYYWPKANSQVVEAGRIALLEYIELAISVDTFVNLFVATHLQFHVQSGLSHATFGLAPRSTGPVSLRNTGFSVDSLVQESREYQSPIKGCS